MKIVYTCISLSLHDSPVWIEYHKLYPEDSLTLLVVDNKKHDD